jgi:hypothetical protein
MKMSHSWNCPDEYEARRRADLDAGYDAREHGRWGPVSRRPYECDEANEAYQREYRYQYEREQEDIASERRAVQRRQEARQQEEYEMQQAYEWDQQRQAEEAEMERSFNEQMEREQAAAVTPAPAPSDD